MPQKKEQRVKNKKKGLFETKVPGTIDQIVDNKFKQNIQKTIGDVVYVVIGGFTKAGEIVSFFQSPEDKEKTLMTLGSSNKMVLDKLKKTFEKKDK